MLRSVAASDSILTLESASDDDDHGKNLPMLKIKTSTRSPSTTQAETRQQQQQQEMDVSRKQTSTGRGLTAYSNNSNLMGGVAWDKPVLMQRAKTGLELNISGGHFPPKHNNYPSIGSAAQQPPR